MPSVRMFRLSASTGTHGRDPSIQTRSALQAQASSCSSQQHTRSLHICTGKTCRRQGSPQILKFTRDLGLEEVEVQERGCLGNCGNGPNIVMMPEEIGMRHVCTPADVLGILQSFSVDIAPSVLQATELRLAGNALAVDGDLQGAVDKYQQALALLPSRGRHMLYSNLSAAYLQLDRKHEALQAAHSAVETAPQGFHMAHVRYIDALYALGKFQEAAAALAEAVDKDRTFQSISEYKVMEQALRKYRPRVAA